MISQICIDFIDRFLLQINVLSVIFDDHEHAKLNIYQDQEEKK